MTSFYRYLAVLLPPLFTRTALSAWATREGGREAATCNITVLAILSGSVHKCASKPASERATERQRRFGLPDRTALPPLPLRRAAVAAASSPPRLLLHLPCFLRGGGGGGGGGEEGRRGRQADRRLSDLEILPLSSLQASRPSVVRSVRRPTTVARSLARSLGWSRRADG